ncbi:hypothetical protein RHMOL_Rhmol13G0179600 [Rhododendron molle]|uniref:Uncharacterized protein n=1 Tax=Rhododendron molle TaxID=49168 RepID=A0ACC0L9E3_RHOML|nr:hypothetical protein RHMOL_Rhmol13G0179600 [Rhododendron molle]
MVLLPSEPDAELMFIGPPYNPPPRLLQAGLDFLNNNIGDLYADAVPSVRLDPASTRNLPVFTVVPPDLSQDFVSRFRAAMPALPEHEPELDMQAVGWAIADSEDYDAPLIQEWFQLK